MMELFREALLEEVRFKAERGTGTVLNVVHWCLPPGVRVLSAW